MNEKLLANIRYYFAQSVFMNNIHYKAYSRLNKTKQRNRNIVIGVSSATIILLIIQIVCLENDLKNLLNVLAFVGLLITGTSLIFTFISKEDISIIMSHHKNIAEQYKCLRDEYMSLIEEVMSSAYSEDELRSKRNMLQKRYSALGEFAPETAYSDYSAAQKGLGLGNNTDEENTWNDAEIDRFLPKQLRIGQE